MDRFTLGILLADLGLIAVFCVLLSRAERTPRDFRRFFLWGVRSGPRTLVALRTSSALFYSGLRSITWGLVFFAAFIVAGMVTESVEGRAHLSDSHRTVLVVIAFLSAMCIVAGLEHLVRSFLRRRNGELPS